MALGRYKTIVDGTTAQAAEINGIQDWFTANAATLISPFTNNLDGNGKQITSLVIETVSATPAATPEGRMVYHTTLDALLVVDGAAVRYVPNVSGGLGSAFHTLRMNSAGTGQEYATTSADYANLTGVGTMATQNTSALTMTGYLDAVRLATPSNPAATVGRIFLRSGAGGATEACILWPSGAISILATSS